jgi:NagD protein
MKQGLLIDMDGVIYGGDELIQGADEFISHLLKKDIPFMFMTNNSQRTRLEVVRKLKNWES